MTIANGRKLLTIQLNGEEVRPVDTHFVIFNPADVPIGAVQSNHALRDSIAKAARTFWKNEDVALNKLNDGYHIEQMRSTDFYVTHAANLSPEN